MSPLSDHPKCERSGDAQDDGQERTLPPAAKIKVGGLDGKKKKYAVLGGNIIITKVVEAIGRCFQVVLVTSKKVIGKLII